MHFVTEISRNLCVCLLELSKSKKEQIFIRLVDTLLDDDEAEILISRMYDPIESTRRFEVPDHTSYQRALLKIPEVRDCGPDATIVPHSWAL